MTWFRCVNDCSCRWQDRHPLLGDCCPVCGQPGSVVAGPLEQDPADTFLKD